MDLWYKTHFIFFNAIQLGRVIPECKIKGGLYLATGIICTNPDPVFRNNEEGNSYPYKSILTLKARLVQPKSIRYPNVLTTSANGGHFCLPGP